HQTRPADVTICYCFHPLSGHSLPVVRLYYLHDEAYYVVRRTDGTPMSVPAWMTRPEAAYIEMVPTARLPVRALLELRRCAETCLSSLVRNTREEDLHAAATSDTPTTTLPGHAGRSRRVTSARRPRGAEARAGAVDAGAGQGDFSARQN
ncbi:MAG TPA: hypothetical protein VES67_07185, partial [Vicinamibacterales bacterium]|nr:hypothetical protein [Vicinamibacterales bacterium]